MWELFQSCMRVFRTGAAACTNQTEPCCVVEGDPKTDWVNVWSLTNGAAAAAAVTTAAESNATVSDHLLTVDENERDVLVAKGWHEVCAPAGGSTAFCQYKVRRAARDRPPRLLRTVFSSSDRSSLVAGTVL
jgi:hypothetical protein